MTINTGGQGACGTADKEAKDDAACSDTPSHCGGEEEAKAEKSSCGTTSSSGACS